MPLLGTFFFLRFQEKAALAKELNDKSTVLAGVKDKTKAYVEKLNKDKAAAVAALEEQVGIRVRATHVVGVNRDAFRLKNRKHTMRLSRAGEKKRLCTSVTCRRPLPFCHSVLPADIL